MRQSLSAAPKLGARSPQIMATNLARFQILNNRAEYAAGAPEEHAGTASAKVQQANPDATATMSGRSPDEQSLVLGASTF